MSRRQRITTALLMAPVPIIAVLWLPTPWLAALVAAVMLAGLCALAIVAAWQLRAKA